MCMQLCCVCSKSKGKPAAVAAAAPKSDSSKIGGTAAAAATLFDDADDDDNSDLFAGKDTAAQPKQESKVWRERGSVIVQLLSRGLREA